MEASGVVNTEMTSKDRSIKMTSELEATIKHIVEKVAQYVEDVATLTVETRYLPIDDGATPRTSDQAQLVRTFDQAQPVARTTIGLDSDSETIIPMRRGKDQVLEVDGELFNIHQANVTAAMTYRTQMMQILLDVLRARRSQG